MCPGRARVKGLLLVSEGFLMVSGGRFAGFASVNLSVWADLTKIIIEN